MKECGGGYCVEDFGGRGEAVDVWVEPDKVLIETGAARVFREKLRDQRVYDGIW